MIKCDKVINTNSAELFYDPPMMSHVIPKGFRNIYTNYTKYWSNIDTLRGSHMIQQNTKCDILVNTNRAEIFTPSHDQTGDP